jgi:dihydroneopterin aldolase
MADRLTIQGLAAECRVGVTLQEQERPQTVWIDLEVPINAAAAAERDDVEATIDYAALAAAVRQHVEQRPYRLLETMAEDVASVVLDGFHAESVTVRIKKRALPGIDHAAVEMTRHSAQ